MTQLTKKRLEAICEALAFKTAGIMDGEEHPREVYEAAHRWATEQLEKRRPKAHRRTVSTEQLEKRNDK